MQFAVGFCTGKDGQWITELVPEYASRQDEIVGRGLAPLRMVIFTKGSSDVLDHAASEIANSSKLGRGSRKKMPGEGFKRPWSAAHYNGCSRETKGQPTL